MSMLKILMGLLVSFGLLFSAHANKKSAGNETKSSSTTKKEWNVKSTQKKLNEMGYNITVDGIMGKDTKQVLRKFQSNQGIAVTGQLDEATKNALSASTSGDRAPASVDEESPSMRDPLESEDEKVDPDTTDELEDE